MREPAGRQRVVRRAHRTHADSSIYIRDGRARLRTVGAHENVFGLEIAVSDALAVQVLESEHHLGRVQPSLLVCEPPAVLQMYKQVATVDVVEHKVQLGVRLEAELQADNKGMLDLCKS